MQKEMNRKTLEDTLLGRFALDMALVEEDRRSVVFCDSLDNDREIQNAALLEDDPMRI